VGLYLYFFFLLYTRTFPEVPKEKLSEKQEHEQLNCTKALLSKALYLGYPPPVESVQLTLFLQIPGNCATVKEDSISYFQEWELGLQSQLTANSQAFSGESR
jgi:hypothetical protein